MRKTQYLEPKQPFTNINAMMDSGKCHDNKLKLPKQPIRPKNLPMLPFTLPTLNFCAYSLVLGIFSDSRK